MYHFGQIIYDLDKQKPFKLPTDGERTTFQWFGVPKRHTYFIEGKKLPFNKIIQPYPLYLPTSVEDAEEKLKLGIIQPAPIPESHCPFCMNWKSNHIYSLVQTRCDKIKRNFE